MYQQFTERVETTSEPSASKQLPVAAKQESPLVVSLREHLSKWYSVPKEQRVVQSDVWDGVEISG